MSVDGSEPTIRALCRESASALASCLHQWGRPTYLLIPQGRRHQATWMATCRLSERQRTPIRPSTVRSSPLYSSIGSKLNRFRKPPHQNSHSGTPDAGFLGGDGAGTSHGMHAMTQLAGVEPRWQCFWTPCERMARGRRVPSHAAGASL